MKRILITISVLIVIGFSSYFFMWKDRSNVEVKEEKIKTETNTVTSEEVLQHRAGVPVDQVWHLIFKQNLDESTVTNETILVKNDEGKEIEVAISYDADKKTIRIENEKDYRQGHTYRIEIDGVKSEQGKTIKSEPFTFTIKRDETETIVLNEATTKIENEIKDMDDISITFRKKTKGIKENDIVIVYPEGAPNGAAMQVENVKNSFTSQVIHYSKPTFTSLFGEVDLYRQIALTENDFDVDEPIIISGEKTKEKVRSYDFEGLAYQVASETKQEGNTIAFQIDEKSIKFGETDAIIHGEVKLINPEILLDITYNEETEQVGMFLDYELDSNLKIDLEEQNEELKDKQLPLSDVRLGKFQIPIEQTKGLVITGELYLELNYDEAGNVSSNLKFTSKSSEGIVMIENETDLIHQTRAKASVDNAGTGDSYHQVQAQMNVALMAYQVNLMNLHGINNIEVKAESFAGNDERVGGKYACTAEEKLFSSLLNVDVNKSQINMLYEVVQDPYEKERDDCTHSLGYVFTQDSMALKAGEQTSIEVKESVIDLRTMKESEQKINGKDITISVKDAGVLNISKEKDTIHIEVAEIPEKAETEIIVKSERYKDDEWTIPVKVKNYDAVMKKIEKEKDKEMADNLNGDWYRVSLGLDNTLSITNATAKSFEYVLDLNYQARFDMDLGTANISEDGKSAKTDPNEEYLGCEYTFILESDSIEVELGNCKSHSNVPVVGLYERERQEVVYPDLSDSGNISKEADAKIKAAAGPYYEHLKRRSLMFYLREDETNEVDATVIETGLVSAGSLAIILIDDAQDVYVGMHSYNEETKEAEEVYFSSNPAYKNKMPDRIEEWFGSSYTNGEVKMLK